MAIFIFQFGLLQPFASLLNSQLPIAILTVLLVVYALYINKLKVKLYVIVSFLLITIFFMLLGLINYDNTSLTLLIYMEFIAKSFVAFYIASLDVDEKNLYSAFIKLALLNFLAIFIFPFVDFLDSMNYMRFGYAMLPSAIMFMFAAFYKKFNPYWFVLAMVALFVTVVYGSRGPIICLLFMVILLFLFTNKLSLIKKYFIAGFSSILLIIVSIIITNQNVILEIINYLNTKGINTYALIKLEVMFSQGIAESSSGRNIIYATLIEYIKESPIWGNGIGHTQQTLDFTAHNLFLQILVESGVIGLIVWLLIWIYVGYKYILISHLKYDYLFNIATLLIAVSIGRLFISSDYWFRPEYWFVLSLLISFKVRKKIEQLK